MTYNKVKLKDLAKISKLFNYEKTWTFEELKKEKKDLISVKSLYSIHANFDKEVFGFLDMKDFIITRKKYFVSEIIKKTLDKQNIFFDYLDEKEYLEV